MLRDFLVIFGIACDERSAIEICRGVPSILGLSKRTRQGELLQKFPLDPFKTFKKKF